MADNLKKQTTTSIVWSSFDKFGFQVVALLVGIITARILSPNDFGLIGALAIFTLLSNVLVESGFSVALIRRDNNTDNEYTAAFCFNIFLSLVFYIGLFFTAPYIAAYFRMPELVDLGRFLFLAIILNSFGIIQNIKLTKELRFRELSIANLTSAVVSGIITVVMALKGYAYWAIAWQQILQVGIRVLMLWLFSAWIPRYKPQFKVIRELFSFSAILIFTSVVSTVVRQVYTFIIGRQYNEEALGYYTQANKFQQIPSNVVSGALSGVAYPVLSKLNDDKERQLLYFRKLMRINAFLIFPIMFGFIGVAENFLEIVLTAKWLPSAPYLKILCVSAMFTPFQTLCLQTLTVIGQPKWNFRLEMLRNLMVLVSVAVCVMSVSVSFDPFVVDMKLFSEQSSIIMLLVGFVIVSFLAYVTNILVVRHFMGYRLTDHLRDIGPYVAISFAMLALVYGCTLLGWQRYATFALQLAVGIGFYLGAAWLLGSKVMRDLVSLIRHKEFDK